MGTGRCFILHWARLVSIVFTQQEGVSKLFQTRDSKCYTAGATGLRAMASQAREVMAGRKIDTSNNDRDR